MSTHNTFKDLIRLYDNLKREEIVILFFHSSLLDRNFTYELKDDNKCLAVENENVNISNGYIKYILDDEKRNFLISRVLIDSEWRKNVNNNYNFIYKNPECNSRYNVHILKIDNSLILQIINMADPSSAHSVTIKINDYININNEVNIKNIEESIHINKLENLFQTHILSNMKLKCTNTTENGFIIKSKLYGSQNKVHNINKDDRFLNEFNDDYFDDKNPALGENIFSNFRKKNSILKPDGLLVGPDNNFFDTKNMRYDPIGPFGLEPNSDKPFEFHNNFPF